MTVKRITLLDDVQSICDQLNDTNWGKDNEMASYDIEALRKYLAVPNNFLVVCYEENIIVSSALAYNLNHPDTTRKSIYLDEIDTRPSYRRRGYATKIIEWFRNMATDSDMNEVWLTTELENNENANNFYKSLEPSEELKTVIYAYKKRT